MTKKHAADYLYELSLTSGLWLKELINETVNTNGNIKSEKYNEIFEHLAYSKNLNETTLEFMLETEDNEIKLKKLEHICGVNALAKNQCIKFSDDVTILHGLNGAGKSSYFRILNEIVGGSNEKKIMKNIYSQELDEIKVNIDYLTNNNINTLKWKGDLREILPFTKFKVFDTSYLEIFLNKRLIDDSVIEPLGLHLFSYLAEKIDQLKNELNVVASTYLTKKPEIEIAMFGDEIKEIFKSSKVSKKNQKFIEDKYIFEEKDNKNLKKIQSLKNKLKQVNYNDKLKVEKNKLTSLNNLFLNIERDYDEISKAAFNLNELLENLSKYQALSSEFKEKTRNLDNIPSSNTDIWKNFIEKSIEYSKLVDNPNEVCIYCRQLLRDDAIDLIKSYNEYLGNESEVNLKSVKKKIEKLNEKVNSININTFKDNEIKEYKEMFENEPITNMLIDRIVCLRKEMILLKKSVCENAINNRKYIYPDLKSKIDKLIQTKLEISNKIENEISLISSESNKKEEKLKELIEKESILVENKSISEQSKNIKEWFQLDNKHTQLVKRIKSIKTNNISRVAKIANEKLVTVKLGNSFKDELKKLGLKLDVKLEKAGTRKGKSLSQLVITKNSKLTKILSEGEQKGTALALFLAELKTQNTMAPIILDDPVNSLDHKIAEKFADSLLDLNNQVVIFNHNRLFLDAFETAKGHHVCKTIKSDCNNKNGKHIKIYEVYSEGKQAKGILSGYKSKKASAMLKEASSLLMKRPFEDNFKVAVLIRRSIESIIDKKLLMNFIPTKYSNKQSRISWDSLKKISIEPDKVDELKTIHSRVSGSELHNGIESNENPIDKEEFNEYVTFLKEILN